jgi:hypothetical protein
MEQGIIMIYGLNFGDNPLVRCDDEDLKVKNSWDTTIEALLPGEGFPPGTYRLAVAKVKSKSGRKEKDYDDDDGNDDDKGRQKDKDSIFSDFKKCDMLDITIGKVGPKGDKGETGSTGATGPQGEQGPRGPWGFQGPQGSLGSQGPAGPTGPAGPEGPEGPQGAEGPPGSPANIDSIGFETYVHTSEMSESPASCNPPNSPNYYRTCSRSCSCSVTGLGSYNYYPSNSSVCGGYSCNPYSCNPYPCNGYCCKWFLGFCTETCYNTCWNTCWNTCPYSCYRWDAETKNCSCNPPNCDPGSTSFSASCSAVGENTCPEGEGHIRTLTGTENATYTGAVGSCTASDSCMADNPTCATPSCSCSVSGNYDETKSCSCSTSCGNSASCATPLADCSADIAILCGKAVPSD